VLKKII